MRNYEDQAERRLRKVNDIKTMFWKRCAEEEKKTKKHYLCSGFQIGKIKSNKEKELKRNYKNRKLSTGKADGRSD